MLTIYEYQNNNDHICFQPYTSGQDRVIIWNSKSDGKFRYEGYFKDAGYAWGDRGTATHAVPDLTKSFKVGFLVTERNVYLFVNDKLECVLLNAEPNGFSLFVQNVGVHFKDVYLDDQKSVLYREYLKKPAVVEYETSTESAKKFLYDLCK